jgi:hypothetical protein
LHRCVGEPVRPGASNDQSHLQHDSFFLYSKNCRLRISDSIECDTQMPSRVTANLLDDGVVDTLVSVGATSSVHTSVSINASDSARIPRAAHRRPALREACQQTRVTDDDGNRLQRYGWRGTSGNCRMSSSVPLFSRTPPSRPQTDTKV